jgi:hypothetical protein
MFLTSNLAQARGEDPEMKKLGFILVFALAFLLITSLTYGAKPPTPPTYIFYYGYATLDDSSSYKIVSDGLGQYIDRNFTSDGGDKIEVQLKYNNKTKGYDLIYFRCFIGKPELPWRSDRRARFNFDVLNSTQGSNYADNETVAKMLAYNNVSFPTVRRPLNDDSVHIAFQKGWYSDSYSNPNENWTAILIDKTDEADANAITQTNLWTLDSDAPRYWTSLEGSSFGSEEDAHDHIAYFVYESKLNFKVLLTEKQGSVDVPIKWEVTPKVGADEISVRTFFPGQFTGNPFPNDVTPDSPMQENRQVLYTFTNGLPFKLIVSKYSLASPAPSKQNILTSAWGEVKGK